MRVVGLFTTAVVAVGTVAVVVLVVESLLDMHVTRRGDAHDQPR